MKINKFYSAGAIGIIFLMILASIPNSISSENLLQNNDENTIKIKVINTFNNQITEHYISQDDFSNLFEISDEGFENHGFAQELENKLTIIEGLNLISEDHSLILKQKFENLQMKYNSNMPNNTNMPKVGIFGFDALNLLNGILFNIKGEKTNSYVDLSVYNFKFFKSNISAMFSAYSEFQGHGYIISLGALAFQSIVSYSLTQNPRFSEIHGAIIGFTGIFIFTEDNSLEPNESRILGIGLNVFTYWNKMD